MNFNQVEKTIWICLLLFVNTANVNSQVTARNWLNMATVAMEEYDINCVAYADSALEIALEQKDSSLLPKIYFIKGKAAMIADFWPKATSYFDNALEHYNALGMECKSLEMKAWKARAICDLEPRKSIIELRKLVALQSDCSELRSGMLEWYLAYPYNQLGKTDSARLYLQEALVFAERYGTANVPDILESLGANYMAKGEHTEALGFYLEAMKRFGQSNRQYQQARSCLMISKIHGNARNDSLALFYINSGMDLLNEIVKIDLPIKLNIAKGNVLFSQGNYKESRTNYKKAVGIFEKSGRLQSELKAAVLAELGLAYLNLSEFKPASDVLSRALVKYKQKGNLEYIRSVTLNLSSAYAQMGQLDSARKYCFELLRIVETAPHRTGELQQVYDMLSYISQWDNDMAAALKYSRRKCAVADSLRQIDLANGIKMTSLSNDSERDLMNQKIKELEITIQDTNEDLRMNLNLQRAYAFALVLFLLGLLIAWFQRKKKIRVSTNLQMNRVKNLEQQLVYKKRDLVSYSLKSLNTQDVLEHVLDSLEDMKRELLMETPKINQLLNQLKLHVNKKDGWESFKFHFEQINPKFFELLEQRSPGLTQNEWRLAALLKMKFDNAEIAKLQNVQVDSIRKAKARLRAKLGVQSDNELLNALNSNQGELG